MGNWFEEWFDTPYYHLLYNNRSEEEASAFIHKLFGTLILTKGKVLDVGCGKGRHARTVSSLGFETTGIDISPNSIEEANQHASSTLHFQVWDMREVFAEKSFDVVMNLFSSFGYFEDTDDDQKAIHAMATALKTDGLLIFDYMNPEAVIKHMKAREIVMRGNIQFHITKRIENGFIKKQIAFIDEAENYCFEEKLQIIPPSRFLNWFESAGLELKYQFGSYDLKPFQSAESLRNIMVAKRK
ncbi:MAG: class I SAM-dependent methyltransferase [Chitinophagales bacterium]